MGFARKVADRVVFMDQGSFVADADKEAFSARREANAPALLVEDFAALTVAGPRCRPCMQRPACIGSETMHRDYA